MKRPFDIGDAILLILCGLVWMNVLLWRIDSAEKKIMRALEHPPIVASPSPSPQGTPEVHVR